jgi:hypothetical protein
MDGVDRGYARLVEGGAALVELGPHAPFEVGAGVTRSAECHGNPADRGSQHFS